MSFTSLSHHVSRWLDKEKRFSHAYLYAILRVRKGFSHLPGWAKLLHLFLLSTLCLSLVNLCLSTLPQLQADLRHSIFTIDLFCCSIFALEFIASVYAAPTFRKLVTWMYLVDFLSFFPFVIECIIHASTRRDDSGYHAVAIQMEGSSYFTVFRILRLIRLFRCFHYFQMSSKFRLMARALKNSISGIFILVSIMPFMILFFASLVYYAEQSGMSLVDGVWYYPDGSRSMYQSIPDCFWIVILTLTTLGYSQEPPKTIAARIILSVAMITSIFLVAFPVTMITIQYQQAVRYFGLKQRRKKSEKELSQHYSSHTTTHPAILKSRELHQRHTLSSTDSIHSGKHTASQEDEHQETTSFFNFNDPYDDTTHQVPRMDTENMESMAELGLSPPLSDATTQPSSAHQDAANSPKQKFVSPLFSLFKTRSNDGLPMRKVATVPPPVVTHPIKVKHSKSMEGIPICHSPTKMESFDHRESHLTIHTDSQVLVANKKNGIMGGVSTHPFGCDVLEMEKEIMLSLGGRWPEKVVLRLQRWWLTTENTMQSPLHSRYKSQSSSLKSSESPVDPDVLVMEVDIRNEDDLRRFIGTMATF